MCPQILLLRLSMMLQYLIHNENGEVVADEYCDD